MSTWGRQRWRNPTGHLPLFGKKRCMLFTITTNDEYEAAIKRVGELTGCKEGTADEAELNMLKEAIVIWDRAHDDASKRKV